MSGLPVERLRVYLRQLPQGAPALLIAQLERAVMRGQEIPGGPLLLDDVRSATRESASAVPRSGDPSRLFFRALDPFLIDDDPAHKHLGHIARKALDPVWAWICRDLAPAETNIFCDEAGRAFIAGDDATCDRLTADLQDCVVVKIQAALMAAKADDGRSARSARPKRSRTRVTLRTFTELQHYLDTGTRTLIDGLRQAGDWDAPFRRCQVDAAVRFCAKVVRAGVCGALGQVGRSRHPCRRRAQGGRQGGLTGASAGPRCGHAAGVL